MLLATLLLVACGDNVGVHLTTAKQAWPVADAGARVTDPAARLGGARMIETDDPVRFLAQYRLENPKTDDPVIAAMMANTVGDPSVGDGRAETCAFFFETAAGVLALVVDAHGAITDERVVGTTGKTPQALSWSVDSSEASDLLAEVDAKFDQLRGASHVAVWDLVPPQPPATTNAYWQGGLLRASPPDGGEDPQLDGDAPDYCELGDFQVDAVTGAILSLGMLHTPTSGKANAQHCDR